MQQLLTRELRWYVVGLLGLLVVLPATRLVSPDGIKLAGLPRSQPAAAIAPAVPSGPPVAPRAIRVDDIVSVPLPPDPVTAPAPAPPVQAATPARAPAAAVRPAPAPAPRLVIGSGQQSFINADRAAAGLAPLTWNSCLAGIAASQAQAMAAAHAIFHGGGVTRDFGCGLGSHQTGENVGVWGGGANDGAINQLFMASPPHRANVLGPYRYVGTAWVVGSDGRGYIAIEFA